MERSPLGISTRRVQFRAPMTKPRSSQLDLCRQENTRLHARIETMEGAFRWALGVRKENEALRKREIYLERRIAQLEGARLEPA